MVKLKILIPILTLALAALACNMPVRTGQTPTPGLFPSLDTGTPAVGEVTATTAPNMATFTFNGLQFSYPPTLASAAQGQIVAAANPGQAATGWAGPTPDYYRVDLNGYPVSNGLQKAQIYLFPVKEFAQDNAFAADMSKKLGDALQAGQPPDKDLPFLPMWNAAQVFAAKAEILTYQSGRGICYLSCYSQAIVPLNSTCLFYTFQALTADGKYYVAAVFPLQMAKLDSSEMKAAFNAAMSDTTKYTAYTSQVKSTLNAAQSADIQPNLDDLDALVKSIVAAPSVTLNAAPTQSAASCPGAMAPRLKNGMHARVTITDGTPLRLRAAAGKDAKIKELIKEGGTMVVTGDATCKDGGLWWPVQVDSTSSTGWVEEGESGTYFVEPVS